jgi:hypothetical protein
MKKVLFALSFVFLTFPAWAQSTLYSNSTTGDVGIGTSAPDALLSLDGQSARTIDMVRETTASTAGNNLTVQAGGAVVGGTNLSGGALNLISGISTGAGSSGINFNIYKAGSSGSSDNSPTTAMALTGAGLNLSSGVYEVNGTQIAASNLLNGVTGSGSIVLAISPTLTTPNIGSATGTSPVRVRQYHNLRRPSRCWYQCAYRWRGARSWLQHEFNAAADRYKRPKDQQA